MVREQNIVILKAALSVQLISCKRSIALLMVKKFLCVVVLTIPALSDLVIMECTFHFQTWNQLDAYPFPTKPSLFAGGRKKGLSVWSSLYPSLRDVWTMPPLLLSFSLSLRHTCQMHEKREDGNRTGTTDRKDRQMVAEETGTDAFQCNKK